MVQEFAINNSVLLHHIIAINNTVILVIPSPPGFGFGLFLDRE